MIEKIRCISCKTLQNYEATTDESTNCRTCGCSFRVYGNIINWNDTPPPSLEKTVFQKLKSAIESGALFERLAIKIGPVWNMPYKILTRKFANQLAQHSTELYSRILKPGNPLSAFWKKRYLHNLQIEDGDRALDFGCGRGRNIAQLQNAGYSVWGIDIQENPWWKNFPDACFHVVPAGNVNLPYPDDFFNIINVNVVLGFFTPAELGMLFAEFSRVLAPGGAVLLIESNRNSFACNVMKKYYGKYPESIDTVKDIASKHFTVSDEWTEGYYSRFFPMTSNLIWGGRQTECGTWMIVDPRYKKLSPEKRGLWVLKLQKPIVAGDRE